MEEKLLLHKNNGLLVLLVTTLLYIAAIAASIGGGLILEDGGNPALFIVGIVWLCVGWIPWCGLKVLKPQEALVLTLFGDYVGTLKKEGFYTSSHENMIIVAPPLIITEEELREAMGILDRVMDSVDNMIK